jgi:hypothetical protein
MMKFVPWNHRSNPAWQFIGLAMLMAVMFLSMFIFRFANEWFNIAFACSFFLLPFLALVVALRLRSRVRVAAAVVLAPTLGISLLFLSMIAIFDIPAAMRHRQFSRDLGSLDQGGYSVYLAWEESAGGALGPHGVRLEQRKTIFPGLYAFRTLDYFERSTEGSLSAVGPDRVELHIPHTSGQAEVDRVYYLKPWLYF